jgi:hypothetical protein
MRGRPVRQSDQFFETLLKFRRSAWLGVCDRRLQRQQPFGKGIGEAYGSGQES